MNTELMDFGSIYKYLHTVIIKRRIVSLLADECSASNWTKFLHKLGSKIDAPGINISTNLDAKLI